MIATAIDSATTSRTVGAGLTGSQIARPIPIAQPTGALPTARPYDELAEDEPLDRVAWRTAPPWLVSAVVHAVLLIVLGLWIVHTRPTSTTIDIDALYADRLGEQLDDESVVSGAETPDVAEKQVITPQDLQPVDDPFATPPDLDVLLDGTTATANLRAPTIGLALEGRSEGMKQVLLATYGGNRLSEEAVLRGLQWLARQQRPDGSWSLKGPYKDGAFNENQEAATAMALLAFLGNNHTHQAGQFKKNVAAGIKALLKVQDAEGNFYQGGRTEWLYTQAQCTIALCELYGMTKDSQLRGPAEKAVKYCIEAQDALGGWRYRPRNDSDTSVTGWMVMALQSARMAGLEVPAATLDKVGAYLDKASPDGGIRYAYQIGGREPDVVMTAEALLCRQYLGWPRDDKRLVAGVEYVASSLPVWADRDVYYWYYGTQVMHHMEGEVWKRWNGALRDMLVEHQETVGVEAGSWDPGGRSPDTWAIRGQGGRLYVTCLSLYMLEVYYRHLPIYAKLAVPTPAPPAAP